MYGIAEPDSIKTLKERRERTFNRMSEICKLTDNDGLKKLTPAERDEFDRLNKQVKEIDNAIRVRKGVKELEHVKGSWAGDKRTEGKANELLRPDQSMSVWAQRAAASGVQGVERHDGTDRDMNRYWAERMGLASASVETRALGEDTSSGAGAGQAIVPQAWSTSFIDLVRAKLLVSRAGATVLPLTTEIYNMPQFLSDVAPVWLAENGSNSLDANPSFGPLVFNCTGAYQDQTLVSRQVLEDTNQDGGLSNLLQQTIAQEYARLLDQVAFYGTAGNAGNPGLVNESGLQTSGVTAPAGFGTNGGSPTSWSQLSIAAEAIRSKNGEPSAFMMNPKAVGTLSRMVDTLGQPMRMTPDIENVPILDSATLAVNETQGTGTALTSVYAGDWPRMIIGMRVDLNVTVLRERYADLGQVGFWSYMRFSIRTSHPELFYRLTGMVTT